MEPSQNQEAGDLHRINIEANCLKIYLKHVLELAKNNFYYFELYDRCLT